MKGTLVNFGTVLVGGGIGLVAGQAVPADLKPAAMHGIGLVVLGLGVKMFLDGKNAIVSAAAMALGGAIGAGIGIQHGVEQFAQFAQARLAGSSQFSAGLILSFILFCVGPMTLLGCLQDGIEGKSELLMVKSTLDGISAFFIAATTGAGVLVTAVLLLLFQGGITLLAKSLKTLLNDDEMVKEITATGGLILVATSLAILEIKDLRVANYTVALVLAPILVLGFRKLPMKGVKTQTSEA